MAIASVLLRIVMFFIDSKKLMSRIVLSAVDMSALGERTRPLMYDGSPHPEYERNSLLSMIVISAVSSRRPTMQV